MKRLTCATLLCVCGAAAACSPHDDASEEALSTSEQELTYTATGPLTKKVYIEPDEMARKANTDSYYSTVQVSQDGFNAAGTIKTKLGTLDQFRTFYGFRGTNENIAWYYNRGDLGIGREMHCISNVQSTSLFACYVKNFAAGDEDTEFRFGMSKDIAFANMDAHLAFATVAMVYSVFGTGNPAEKIFFAVYDAAGNLSNAAPLDRHGLNFSFKKTDGNGVVGTPGVNFNNHIPSNCLNCHGGSYDSTRKRVSGAQFLPFDLDQFDYQDYRADHTREAQKSTFTRLNTLVKSVAERQGGLAPQVKRLIDGWYANGEFDSNYVPPGWQTNDATRSVYTSVVKGACRNCHVTSSLSFETADGFPAQAVANDLCALVMPHAHQSVREFWQSSRPLQLETYFRGVDGTAAERLKSCSTGDVVTLDPHLFDAAVSTLL